MRLQQTVSNDPYYCSNQLLYNMQRVGNCRCKTRSRANVTQKILEPFLDLCVSSLREGHANLLCIVPILTDVAEATACGRNDYYICFRN